MVDLSLGLIDKVRICYMGCKGRCYGIGERYV